MTPPFPPLFPTFYNYATIIVMAKLKSPLFSFAVHGTLLKNLTFKRKGKSTIVEHTPLHKDLPTSLQNHDRLMFQKCIDLWHALSPEEQQTWESNARRKHMTGYNYFISLCLRPNPGIYLPLAGGTMQGPIDMDSHKIVNLPSPSGNSDADTKLARDSAIAVHSAISTAHHVRPQFAELASTPYTPAAGSWQSWDISSLCPSGALAALVMMHSSDTRATHVMGSRKTGSSLSRTVTMGFGASCFLLTPLTSSRLIEIYHNSVLYCSFAIYGYWY